MICHDLSAARYRPTRTLAATSWCPNCSPFFGIFGVFVCLVLVMISGVFGAAENVC
jgi:hypothetical protein